MAIRNWSSTGAGDTYGQIDARWSTTPSTATWSPLNGNLNLKVWLDLSDTTLMTPVPTDGVAIQAITDKSTNAFSFVGSVNQYPLWKANQQNGRGAGLWDGSNDYLKCNITTDLTDFTVGIIAKPTTSRAFNCFVSSDSQTAGQLTFEQAATASIDCYIIGTGARGGSGNNTYLNNAWQSCGVKYTSGAGVTYVGGVALGSFTTAGARLEASSMGIGFDISGAGFFDFNGYIGEVLIFGSVLGASDLASMWAFLNSRWGL